MKYKAPVVITSLGAREDVNAAVHSYGGVVMHDIINKPLRPQGGREGRRRHHRGGGRARAATPGVLSPFALVEEIREWFDGPLALSGAISTGRAVLAAQAMGADFGYVGSAFIATKEANAIEGYKQMIAQSAGDDIVYTNLFTGVHGNYLRPSIVAAGLDPDNLPVSDPSKMNFGSGGNSKAKAWKDIWGCGQGIGAVKGVIGAGELVARLKQEYDAAKAKLTGGVRVAVAAE